MDGFQSSSFVMFHARLLPRYKYRLVVDESVALGVLGATGRGAAQAAGLTTRDVDIVAASLSAPIVPTCTARQCQGVTQRPEAVTAAVLSA